MKRRRQRCPYCGKRMSYFSAFSSRRKAEFVCTRCGKESRVVISKVIIPIYIIVAVLSLSIMGVWIKMNYLSNPLGILLVTVPFVIFLFVTPKFVSLEPLKKYQKSMEAKKAGKEFSDNLNAFELDDEVSSSLENSGQFKINSELFNQIKAERNSSKEQLESDDLVSNSNIINNEDYVSIIDDNIYNDADTVIIITASGNGYQETTGRLVMDKPGEMRAVFCLDGDNIAIITNGDNGILEHLLILTVMENIIDFILDTPLR